MRGDQRIAGSESHFLGAVSRDFVVVSRLGVSILAPYASAQSKGPQRKASCEGGPEFVFRRAKPTNISTADWHTKPRACVAGFRPRRTFCGEIRSGNRAPNLTREHVGFEQLKIYTYTPEESAGSEDRHEPSVLDLKTRILSSKARTTIQRRDFNIAGDSVEFDTNSKTGRLIGT